MRLSLLTFNQRSGHWNVNFYSLLYRAYFQAPSNHNLSIVLSFDTRFCFQPYLHITLFWLFVCMSCGLFPVMPTYSVIILIPYAQLQLQHCALLLCKHTTALTVHLFIIKSFFPYLKTNTPLQHHVYTNFTPFKPFSLIQLTSFSYLLLHAHIANCV